MQPLLWRLQEKSVSATSIITLDNSCCRAMEVAQTCGPFIYLVQTLSFLETISETSRASACMVASQEQMRLQVIHIENLNMKVLRPGTALHRAQSSNLTSSGPYLIPALSLVLLHESLRSVGHSSHNLGDPNTHTNYRQSYSC